MLSFRLRGFEDGGLGGSGLFNLAAVAGDGFKSDSIALGSEGGSFSLDGLCFRDGLGLAQELGLDEEGSSAVGVSLKIAFLGNMKCFIAEIPERGGIGLKEDKEAREMEESDRERDREM